MLCVSWSLSVVSEVSMQNVEDGVVVVVVSRGGASLL